MVEDMWPPGLEDSAAGGSSTLPSSTSPPSASYSRKVRFSPEVQAVSYGSEDFLKWCMSVQAGEHHEGEDHRTLILVDSGSDEHLCPASFAPRARLAPRGALKRSRAVAPMMKDVQGNVIENKGTKVVGMSLGNGLHADVEFVVGPVKNPLLSAGKLVRRGYQIGMDPEGGHYLAKDGVYTPLRLIRNSLYLEAWIDGKDEKAVCPAQAEPMEAELEEQPKPPKKRGRPVVGRSLAELRILANTLGLARTGSKEDIMRRVSEHEEKQRQREEAEALIKERNEFLAEPVGRWNKWACVCCRMLPHLPIEKELNMS